MIATAILRFMGSLEALVGEVMFAPATGVGPLHDGLAIYLRRAAPRRKHGHHGRMKKTLLFATVLAMALSYPFNSSNPLAALDVGTQWINSPPLTKASLRGKVVVVQFWTYSCINWRRQLPYVRAWAEKYGKQGLVVVGVHTPEFEFERELVEVRAASADMNVPFPIAIDNDYRIWSAFANTAWPALFYIDATGRLRHHYFGEGDYEASERLIQTLLQEAGHAVGPELVSVRGRGLEAPPDFAHLRTPETYLGRERATGHATLSKGWRIDRQRVVSSNQGERIAIRFHARDLHLVMGPTGKEPVRFRVLLDGKPPGADRGDDVDEDGNGTAGKRTLYQLIRQKGAIGERSFEIEFLDPGSEVYSFTFG